MGMIKKIIKMITEQEMETPEPGPDIFQPATKDDVKSRKSHVALMNRRQIGRFISAASGRKPCYTCSRMIPKNERYLSVGYSSRWGGASKAICKDCLKVASQRTASGTGEMRGNYDGVMGEDSFKPITKKALLNRLQDADSSMNIQIRKAKEAAKPYSLGPGKYFIGDMGYVMDDKIYEWWLDQTPDVSTDGYRYTFNRTKGEHTGMFYFAVASTAYGDGNFEGSDGRYYPVDAGIIGVTPFGLTDPKKQSAGLGRWVKANNSIVFRALEGLFIITIDGKDLVINTQI